MEPALVFVVSCCTRGAILHSRCDAEVRGVQEVFGRDVPVFGYYSGGEIAPFLSAFDEITDPDRPLSGSHFHAGTAAIMAVGREGGADTVTVPDPSAHEPAKEEELDRLRAMLSQSEDVFDDIEKFMANISRKSYRDGERLREQNAELEQKNEHNEKLQSVVHRYTPHDIWTKLGDNVAQGVYELADDEGRFCFLFLDVKGFTTFSENHDAPTVVSALNEIFQPATDIVYDCGGDVDKYIGDCIFAVFRGPDEAMEAARRILELTAAGGDGKGFAIRIGINSGRAVRANVGSGKRREYTYIGDAVNLAQRLESNCTPGCVLVSEQVHDASKVRFGTAEPKIITVKGKAQPVRVYEISL